MICTPLRIAAFAGIAMLLVSCARRRDESSAFTDSSTAAIGAPAAASAATSAGAANSDAPATRKLQSPRAHPLRRDTVSRQPTNPCGGVYVNVMVRASALGASTDMASVERSLRRVAAELTAELGANVVEASVRVSPAIRVFRVTARDRAAADAAVAQLRASSRVENVELDACNLRSQEHG